MMNYLIEMPLPTFALIVVLPLVVGFIGGAVIYNTARNVAAWWRAKTSARKTGKAAKAAKKQTEA